MDSHAEQTAPAIANDTATSTVEDGADDGLDAALDSLHTLPLSIMPIQSPGLRKATMIKNAKLESVIELFRDTTSGSGQITPTDIPNFFENSDESLLRDVEILENIGTLQSFDVFTLRSELRRIDIGFEDYGVLALSEAKKRELTIFMRDFTRPLISRIYGDNDNAPIKNISEIVDRLSNPDRETAIKRLNELAGELDITIEEVPTFLNHYGDVFLSLSYFRQCLRHLSVQIPAFQVWMQEIQEVGEIQGDAARLRLLDAIRTDLAQISRSISTHFGYFEDCTKTFWDDVSAESFREFGALVTAQHVGIATVLCGLTVKLGLWRERFPTRAGSPTKRIEFLSSEILPGLERIKTIQTDLARESRVGQSAA